MMQVCYKTFHIIYFLHTIINIKPLYLWPLGGSNMLKAIADDRKREVTVPT